jgi:DNA invertase Pin-like site-specific DNA recombinase
VRCAVYPRTSTDEGLESDFNSLDAQRESGENYVASHRSEGWAVLPARYDDGGYSGATLDRPGLQRLLADIEAGSIDVVIVYKIDRLSRYLPDFAKLIEIFDRHHVSLVSVTESFDTSTPMGRLTLHMLLSFAQFEREVITERIRDKVAAAKRRGKYCGGAPVFGYDVDRERKRLVVNPKEAPLVPRIFADFIRTPSCTALAQKLTEEGYTTKSWTTKKGITRPGGHWNKGHIYRLLHNPLYIGEVLHKGQRYPGEHEPIVSRKLWDQAQAILHDQHRAPGLSTRAKTEALLRGILRCAHCGSAMGPTFTRRRGKVYRYYLCVHASKNGHDSCPTRCLSAGEIERTVMEQLRTVFRTPEIVAQTCREARAQVEQGAAQGEAFSEPDVVGALHSLDPIWERLFPQERERIVRLLVRRVDVYPDRAELQIRAEGLASLVTELGESTAEEEQAA